MTDRIALYAKQAEVYADQDIEDTLNDEFAAAQFELFAEYQEDARRLEASFRDFMIDAWSILEPGKNLEWNWHLSVICKWIEAFHDRRLLKLPCGRIERCNRLLLNVPYRTSKSTIMQCYNAWAWTKDPTLQFLCLSNSDDLATRDGLAVRNLLQSDWYQQRWGHKFGLADDQNTKKNYKTTVTGHRNSQSITANLIGKGGDTVIVDDPHDAGKVMSDAYRKQVLNKYDHGVSTRLNDPSLSGIIVIMQRLHPSDLVGHLLKDNQDADGEYWFHLRFPMLYDDTLTFPVPEGMPGDKRTKKGEMLWPSRFPKATVATARKRLGKYGFLAQMQQAPQTASSGILDRQWWRVWPEGRPLPTCKHTTISLDTAYSEKDWKQQQEAVTQSERSRSAATIWGVFFDDNDGRYKIFLRYAWADHVAYPALKRKAKELIKTWKPDRILIEDKASGISLRQDLRMSGIPITPYNPGVDKVARAYAVSPMLEDGTVYYPDRKWADEVINECAEFPGGPLDDYVDTLTQQLIWFRNGWFTSYQNEPDPVNPADDMPLESFFIMNAEPQPEIAGGVYG